MSLRNFEKPAKKEPLQIDSKKVAYLVIAIIIILAIAYFFLQTPEKKFNENEILKVTKQESSVQDFISQNPSYNVKILQLTLKNVTSLSQEFPALYGDLPKTELYRAEYVFGDDGIFVLVNKNMKIVKYFKVHSIGLGSMQL